MEDYNHNRPWRRAFSANKTGGFTAKAITLTEPSGSGVIEIGKDGVRVPARVKLAAVGVGADNDAFSVRVWGWSKCLGSGDHPNGGTGANVWMPFRIAELGFILGAGTGAAGGVVPATELRADTVTIIATGEGTTTADVTRAGNITLYSPADGTLAAFAIVKVLGFDKIEFDTDDTTNTPTMNVLYSLL